MLEPGCDPFKNFFKIATVLVALDSNEQAMSLYECNLFFTYAAGNFKVYRIID